MRSLCSLNNQAMRLNCVSQFSGIDQNVALLAGMIIAGGERLYDIGRLANDQTIGELFGRRWKIF